jgi:hypothetical protein
MQNSFHFDDLVVVIKRHGTLWLQSNTKVQSQWPVFAYLTPGCSSAPFVSIIAPLGEVSDNRSLWMDFSTQSLIKRYLSDYYEQGSSQGILAYRAGMHAPPRGCRRHAWNEKK